MSWTPLERLLTDSTAHAPLREKALRLAGGLRARGVQRLAVHLEDAAQLGSVLLGAWRAGVQVLLPADVQAASRARLANDADAWLSDQPGDLSIDELLGEPLAAAPLDPDWVGLSLSTSGSSGEPKRIDKQLRQIGNELNTLEALWGANLAGAHIIGSVSTQHIYGLLFRLLWPLCAGRSFEPRALPFPEDLQLASLAEQRPFAWVASPALLKRMGDNLDWSALSPVRKVFSSGGALPAEAGERLQQLLGQYPAEIYGSSETGGIAWRQGGSLWQPFDGVELSVGEDGALQIASPCLPTGHFEQSADAARLQADGRFELLGRLDRIVKLEEKRISLPMLEQALGEHEWVSEARLGVIEENRAYLGALLALSPAGLHALRNQGRRTLTETLRRHLANYCEPLALPRRWRLLLQLPCNNQGKLAQAEVDRLLGSERPKQPEVLDAQAQDGGWVLTLGVPVDLAHFSGHFPQTPVLPGVVQVDWALQLAQQQMQLPPRFAGMEVLKFQQLLRPGDQVELTLSFDEQRSKLHFAFRQNGNAASSGRILLAAAQP
jgi:acyl-coenzyme A synthetase/AMP-(fatty) acid ligase/3-hydroxymyristoyl/3-hydroxydecanoyl-(acyl carrier protein) dehydratase